MKTLHYAGMSLSTGDRIADALLSSIPTGHALSRYVVASFPARMGGRPVEIVRLVLSPSTQLLVTSAPAEGHDDATTRDDAELDARELTSGDLAWFPLDRSPVAVDSSVEPDTPTADAQVEDDDFDYDYQELF